jgi:hypothetical protein
MKKIEATGNYPIQLNSFFIKQGGGGTQLGSATSMSLRHPSNIDQIGIFGKTA